MISIAIYKYVSLAHDTTCLAVSLLPLLASQFLISALDWTAVAAYAEEPLCGDKQLYEMNVPTLQMMNETCFSTTFIGRVQHARKPSFWPFDHLIIFGVPLLDTHSKNTRIRQQLWMPLKQLSGSHSEDGDTMNDGNELISSRNCKDSGSANGSTPFLPRRQTRQHRRNPELRGKLGAIEIEMLDKRSFSDTKKPICLREKRRIDKPNEVAK
ncbi:hypothetical protein HYALB_00012890 [Hymenoscyphus albidus]|uniref:Uncharacterized protein n=1 Tax=Hymenoscyphus albidus TaxID=595503 RepID=A0A9N9Q6M6_9HELO|nr:hypothetical protein HYALB_00012890 [Hymenoscyphus albidus]